MTTMSLGERLRFRMRTWRYRLRSEKFAIAYVLQQNLRGKTAVDIGANLGIYSYWLHRKVRPGGQIIAFEPQPELAAGLHTLKETFKLGGLEIVEAGLSDKLGSLTLLRPTHHWGGASFEQDHPDASTFDKIEVAVTTLDTHFPAGGRKVDFIKCDVEGHELSVFRGGEQLLRRDRPTLLFECLDKNKPDCAVFEYLKSLEYDGFCFYRHSLAPVEQLRELLPKMHKRGKADFVFLPRESQQARRYRSH